MREVLRLDGRALRQLGEQYGDAHMLEVLRRAAEDSAVHEAKASARRGGEAPAAAAAALMSTSRAMKLGKPALLREIRDASAQLSRLLLSARRLRDLQAVVLDERMDGYKSCRYWDACK